VKLVLARHGQTDWNVLKFIQGHRDIELNDEGRRQAEALADAVRHLGIVHAYASDLKRAAETARIIARKLGIPHALDHRFRECHFGTMDGMPYSFGRGQDAVYPHNRPDWQDPLAADFTPYGGETARALFDRQHAALRDLHLRHSGETVLVIGHGRSLRVLAHGLGRPQPHFGNCDHFITDFHPQGQ